MAPNGYDPDEIDGRHETRPRPFKEVMEEALEIMRVEMGQPGFCGIGTPGIDIVQLAKDLRNATGIPEKAKPFVKKINEISDTLEKLTTGLDELTFVGEMLSLEKSSQDKINELEQLLAELVEASSTNNSLQKFSQYIIDQINTFLLALKEISDQSQEVENLVSGLDDLFEDDK